MKDVHFKMSSIKDVIGILQENCFFHDEPEDRKCFRFLWKNQSFQFTCLPQRLTSAPGIFTKLLKPIVSQVRKLGILIDCYIDDCIPMASSVAVLEAHVTYALQIFDSIGLTVNVKKKKISVISYPGNGVLGDNPQFYLNDCYFTVVKRELKPRA